MATNTTGLGRPETPEPSLSARFAANVRSLRASKRWVVRCAGRMVDGVVRSPHRIAVALCLAVFAVDTPVVYGPVARAVEFIDVTGSSGDDGLWFVLLVPDGAADGPAQVGLFPHRHSEDAGMRASTFTARLAAANVVPRFTVPSGPFPHVWTGYAAGLSGGLAFTLATIDRAVPGPLAGSLVVAATGTVDVDGHIGPVRQLAAKYRAAAAAHADVLIVPSGQASEFDAAPGGPVVLEAASVTEAVVALCRLSRSAACRSLHVPGSSTW